jgi:DNA-binding transcriptional ArsR family regulator
MMDFSTASRFGAVLARDYAEDFFKLLANYQDISASEAASRLSLHIQTAQDYLDTLTELGITQKTEVFEKKRPYYRYTLVQPKIKLELDLSSYKKENPGEGLSRIVREKKENGANFSLARGGDSFSTVTVWEGEGRERREHKISLTTPQGKFLFHLPFPQARPLTIAEVMEKAGVEEEYSTEIQDIVDELIRQEVIEVL